MSATRALRRTDGRRNGRTLNRSMRRYIRRAAEGFGYMSEAIRDFSDALTENGAAFVEYAKGDSDA